MHYALGIKSELNQEEFSYINEKDKGISSKLIANTIEIKDECDQYYIKGNRTNRFLGITMLCINVVRELNSIISPLP